MIVSQHDGKGDVKTSGRGTGSFHIEVIFTDTDVRNCYVDPCDHEHPKSVILVTLLKSSDGG